MQSGKLRKTIIIEKCTPTKGEDGQRVEVWSTFKTRKATKATEKGFQHNIMDRQQAVTTTLWYIRKTDGINHKMRVNYNGKYYYLFQEPTADVRDARLSVLRTKEDSDA